MKLKLKLKLTLALLFSLSLSASAFALDPHVEAVIRTVEAAKSKVEMTERIDTDTTLLCAGSISYPPI